MAGGLGVGSVRGKGKCTVLCPNPGLHIVDLLLLLRICPASSSSLSKSFRSSTCPTILRALAKQCPPCPRPPVPPPPPSRRNPERPNRKAPSAPSRAATLVGFAERFVFVPRTRSTLHAAHRPPTRVAPIFSHPFSHQKCDEQPNEDGFCQTCVRLRLQCLGFGAKRPDWMRVRVSPLCSPVATAALIAAPVV